MKINTLVEFIWNSNTKEYEEVYSESYDYNGELELAFGDDEESDDTSTGQGSRDWNPDSFFVGDTAMSPDDIAEGFGLDASEYSMYFPDYDDWKKDFAEKDFTIATEEKDASVTLLDALKGTEETRLEEKGQEAGTSLAQQIGSTYSQASTSYLDATKQQVGQQISFTSGATGRQREDAFKRTQDTLMDQTTQQNLAYTSTMRDITQAESDLESQYTFDTGKVDRDFRSAEIDKDYKVKAGKVQWEDSIYDALSTLGQIEAWG